MLPLQERGPPPAAAMPPLPPPALGSLWWRFFRWWHHRGVSSGLYCFYCCSYYLRSALRSARVCAWKPDRMVPTDREEPQLLQCTKYRRLTASLVRSVLGERHVEHATYSPMYLRSRLSMYLGTYLPLHNDGTATPAAAPEAGSQVSVSRRAGPSDKAGGRGAHTQRPACCHERALTGHPPT